VSDRSRPYTPCVEVLPERHDRDDPYVPRTADVAVVSPEPTHALSDSNPSLCLSSRATLNGAPGRSPRRKIK